MLGSRRFPSRFHMTGLSGVDDWQLTTIESPGCKNERAGSNLICGAVKSDAGLSTGIQNLREKLENFDTGRCVVGQDLQPL